MKERPILFSGAMVRALLDGTKTQTRRVYKNRFHPDFGCEMAGSELVRERQDVIDRICPYGQPGDRLWVRETWGVVSNDWDEDGNLIDWVPDRPATDIHEMRFGQGYYSGHTIYAADGAYEWAGDDDGGGEPRSAWHPSIHMPRAASRILLEIVSVRVERLNECSAADAVAEGIRRIKDGFERWHPCQTDVAHEGMTRDPVLSYRGLWESINGAGSWAANPWVWVICVRRIEP